MKNSKYMFVICSEADKRDILSNMGLIFLNEISNPNKFVFMNDEVKLLQNIINENNFILTNDVNI